MCIVGRGKSNMFTMDKDFKDWLNRNHYGTYNGMKITPETEMVAYTYVISVIVLTYRKSTRYYFKEAEAGKALAAKILCILCNLIVGWWGIPWGPIWTIKETFCNLINKNTVMWGTFAGKPVENSDLDYTEQQPQEIFKEQPKAKKKIPIKDILIYITIGAIIAVALIVADMNGML